MFDAATARRMMVDGQVRTADVTNLDLIAAMSEVPRERFVPAAFAEQAYVDRDLPIGHGRFLLKPMVLAKLIQNAGVGAGDRVLDVACGTGYSSAVLARLASAVTALEQEPSLAQQARQSLSDMTVTNAVVVTGSLTDGWAANAPYDVILLNGATEIVPEALGRQLAPNGRLVGVFGRGPASKAMNYRSVEGRLVGRPIFDAGAAVLPGFVAPPAFVF